MQEVLDKSERRRLLSVARRYRKAGYEVVVQPQKSQLPDFLTDFAIDLLGRNGKENVVVEVKSRRALSRSNCLVQIAEALDKRPGWRLDLVMTNPRVKPLVDEDVALLNESEIHHYLAQAAELTERGNDEAALLLVWSAAEGALRRLAEQAKIRLKEQTPAYLLTALYTNGVIGKEDYDLLEQAAEYRTILIHGYKWTPRTPDVVNMIARTIEKLIERGA